MFWNKKEKSEEKEKVVEISVEVPKHEIVSLYKKYDDFHASRSLVKKYELWEFINTIIDKAIKQEWENNSQFSKLDIEKIINTEIINKPKIDIKMKFKL